jgi:hypothetical protein
VISVEDWQEELDIVLWGDDIEIEIEESDTDE